MGSTHRKPKQARKQLKGKFNPAGVYKAGHDSRPAPRALTAAIALALASGLSAAPTDAWAADTPLVTATGIPGSAGNAGAIGEDGGKGWNGLSAYLLDSTGSYSSASEVTVLGGAGGVGGNAGDLSMYVYGHGGAGGDGGNGGEGVSGDGFALENAGGSIAGGSGGGGGKGGYAGHIRLDPWDGGNGGAGGTGGSGGAGISGSGLTVTNSAGTISGGIGGAGGKGGVGGRGWFSGGTAVVNPLAMGKYWGGYAGSGGDGEAGGSGGAGVYATGLILDNRDSIVGGAGGAGGAGAVSGREVSGTSNSGSGGMGGSGGAGVYAIDSSLANSGSILGGNGGNGGKGGNGVEVVAYPRAAPAGDGGAGGWGGAGVSGSGFSLTNSGNIAGGSGGSGGGGGNSGIQPRKDYYENGTPGAGGDGGMGGAGVSGTGFALFTSGAIFGGGGGAGGGGGNASDGGMLVYTQEDGWTYTYNNTCGPLAGVFLVLCDEGYSALQDGGNGGNGGNGGAGVTGSDFTVTNSGLILGGDGGNGGAGGLAGDYYTYPVISDTREAIEDPVTGNFSYTGELIYELESITPGVDGMAGTGGNGGDGVSGAGFTLTNSGSVVGGNGGSGSVKGLGGVGVISTGNSTIYNSGTLTGGWNGSGSIRANAVEFSGGGNKLVLEAGSTINGNVVSSSGSTNGGDTLALGGSADSSFAVSAIGATAQYRGFQNFAKEGSSIWTLTGTTATVTSWNILEGTLSVSSDSNLGNASGGLTLNGGTLLTTTDFSSARAITLGGSGGTLDNGGNADSFTGVIAGSGRLTVAGAGTTTLAGINAHTGGTSVVDGATLSIGSDSNLGDPASGLTLNGGTLLTAADFSSARAITLGGSGGTLDNGGHAAGFSGVISGSGGLLIAGAGTTTLAGINTYLGGTTVNGTTLSIGSDSSLGNASGGLTLDGGTLLTTADVSSARAVTLGNGGATLDNGGHTDSFSGVISGSGSLTVAGPGTTALAGINTYLGGTAVNGATLSIGSDSNLGDASGGLTLDGGTLLTTADFSSARTITLGNGGATLDNGGNADSFTGVISGSGSLTVAGAGTTTLTGINTHTGGTTVDNGATLILSNGAAIGTLAINNGGMFNANTANTGTINNAGTLSVEGGKTLTVTGGFSNTGTMTLSHGAAIDALVISNGGMLNANTANTGTINNTGTLSVEDSKTLTVTGDFSNAGTFATTVSSDISYGKLVVTGTATLASNMRIDVNVVDPLYTFTTSSLDDIISAGTLSSDGTFSVKDNSFLFDFSAVLDGNTVDLTVQAVNFATDAVTATGNTSGRDAARALDSVIHTDPSSPLSSLFVGLTSQQAVSDAVSQSLPLLTGNSQLAAFNTLSGINQVIQARLEHNLGLSAGDDFYGDRRVWMKPFGSWADQGARNAVAGFDAGTMGVVLGADATPSAATRLGVAFAYAKSNVNSKSSVAPQGGDIDLYQLIGYGSYSLDPNTEVNFQVDVGNNQNKGRRYIPFAFSVADSDYDSDSAHAGVGLGRAYALTSQTRLTPSVRADYTWLQDESYSETGAGALNLNVDSRSAEQLILALDGKLIHDLDCRTKLSANLGVGYDVINDQALITSTFAGAPGASFVTSGIEPSPWIGRAGLGVVHTLHSGMELAARYDVEAREDFTNQTASVKARWTF